VIQYLQGVGVYGDRSKYPIPALLILDLKLPCVSGVEVLKWLRSEPGFRMLPVVVLTSSTLGADVEEAWACGANSYVVKPASPDLLVGIMRDFANWWLRHNVLPGRQ
jgi:CheY-like chemotaxis protein